MAGSHLYDYLLGATKSSQESLEKAIEVAQKIIAMDDGYPSGHGLLSCLYPYKREYDKAIADFTHAILLQPDYPRAYRKHPIRIGKSYVTG